MDTTRGSRRAPIATATPARGRSSAPTSISVSSTFRSRCRPATTTAATGRAIRCSTRVWSRSTSRPASASGITRSTHHGLWDYDPPCAPVLYDVVVNGRRVRALAQPTKQAFLFVLNRETGEPIWPIEERAVPQSTVPNERTSPTQPFPTKPLPFDRQGVSVDDLIDFTPALRAEALEVIKKYTIGPLYTPPSLSNARRPARHDSAPGRYGRRQLAGRVIRSGNQPPLYSFAHGRLPRPASFRPIPRRLTSATSPVRRAREAQGRAARPRRPRIPMRHRRCARAARARAGPAVRLRAAAAAPRCRACRSSSRRTTASRRTT